MMVKLARSRFVQMLGDGVVIYLVFQMAFLLRFAWRIPLFNYASFQTVTPWLLLSGVVLLAAYDLYGREPRQWNSDAYSVVTAVGLHVLAVAAISFTLRGFTFPRSVLLIAGPLEIAGLLLWRYLLYAAAFSGTGVQRVLVLGQALDAEHLVAHLPAGRVELRTLLACSSGEELSEVITAYRPDIVCVGCDVTPEIRWLAVSYGLDGAFRVYILPSPYELLLTHSRFVTFGETPMLAISPVGLSFGAQLFKRFGDIAVGSATLIIAFPVMALLGFVIWVTDGSPVMYRQERVTLNGRVFTLYKFRTMRVDAETSTGPVFSSGANDPRLTKVGTFLRSSRLDELPQLFNVVRGDMTLVGPRPERPFFVDRFNHEVPAYRYRHNVKAGLTGLAQVEGRYSTAVEDKVRYDLFYSTMYSPLLDIHILLRTVRAVLMRSKAT